MIAELTRPVEAVEEKAQVTRAWDVAGQRGPTTYYRYPALKKPDWSWEIPTYFFTGGLAAGAYLIATLADLFGTEEEKPISRAGRYVALMAIIVSPLLLIGDLGRPRRFLNMMRVFKFKSPMNVGTWGLTIFGAFAGLSILRQWVNDGVFGRKSFVARALGWVPLRVSGVLGSLFAFFAGGYTGVLLSFTNNPIWAKNRLLQGPLFLSSALSTGLAAISIWLSMTGGFTRRSEHWFSRVEDLATMGDAILTAGMFLTIRSLARPFLMERYAFGFWPGAVGLGIALPTILRRIQNRSSGDMKRTLRIASAISVLLGGYIFRWTEARAGWSSFDNPDFYFTYTRAGERE